MNETIDVTTSKVKIDKAICNNKPDIITCDNETGIRVLNEVANSGHRNVTTKGGEKTKNMKNIDINIGNVERKNKSDTSKERANWNHIKFTQKICEKYGGKVRNQGITGTNHAAQCAHTSKSANVSVQRV
jgi:hypothetical protein